MLEHISCLTCNWAFEWLLAILTRTLRDYSVSFARGPPVSYMHSRSDSMSGNARHLGIDPSQHLKNDRHELMQAG